MTTGQIILMVFLILLVVLNLTRVGIRMKYADSIRLELTIGPFHKLLRKKIAEDSSAYAADENYASEQTKKDEKEKKSLPPIDKKLISDGLNLIKSILSQFAKGLHWDPLTVTVEFATNDPANTAQMFGYINAIAWPFLVFLEQVNQVHHRQVELNCNFESNKTIIDLDIGLSFRIGRLIWVVLCLLGKTLIIYLSWKHRGKKKDNCKKPAETAA